MSDYVALNEEPTRQERPEVFHTGGGPLGLPSRLAFWGLRVAASPFVAACYGEYKEMILRPIAGALYPAGVAVTLVAAVPLVVGLRVSGNGDKLEKIREEYIDALNGAEAYIYAHMPHGDAIR